MTNYIREQSAGDIISNTMQIYAKNFRVLFLITVIPVIPMTILKLPFAVDVGPGHPIHIILTFAEYLVMTFITAPITVAVSDYCLGNKPGVRRSYKSLASVFGKFISTFFLITLFESIGFLLLVIPGIIFAILFLFSMTTVPLERRGGLDALNRSIELGKEYRWRNFGIILLVYLIFFVGIAAIGMLWGLVAAQIVPETGLGLFLVSEIGNYIGLVFAPVAVIPVVLLYYDMRVRKENYDNAALAQDMVG